MENWRMFPLKSSSSNTLMKGNFISLSSTGKINKIEIDVNIASN